MFTIRPWSSKMRIDVELPSAALSRQTKPGACSASALTGSRAATKAASAGESSGARSRMTFTCARSWAVGMAARLARRDQAGQRTRELLARHPRTWPKMGRFADGKGACMHKRLGLFLASFAFLTLALAGPSQAAKPEDVFKGK